MGSDWHRKAETSRKEWVLYGAAGITLLIVAGIVAGVVVATSNKGSGDTANVDASTPGTTNGAAVGSPPPAALPSPPPAPVVVPSPSPSPSPAAAPVVAPPALSPSPVPASAVPPSPVPASPAPATPAPTTSAPTTYDPNYVAKGTVGNTRTADGFVPMVIPAGKQGTCELSTKNQHKCNDGMEGAVDSTDYTLLSMMVDPEAMQRCGFSDMDKIVNSLVKWAYKGKCGIESYTLARACIGNTGTAGEGHWRARAMLWPTPGSTDPSCTPLCIKMRGSGDTVADYGRHGSCNAPTGTRRRLLVPRDL